MFPLDNGNMRYTWKNEWIRPYESAWNIGEKIFATNISDNIYNDLMGIAANGTKIYFQPDKVTYSKGRLNSNFISQCMQKSKEQFSVFYNLNYFVSTRIRYCSECASYGYHSVFHQMLFMDKCFIHGKKLKYLCSCDNNAVISRRSKTNKAFSCKICNREMPYVDVAEGILGKWYCDVLGPIKSVSYSKEVKKIYCIDIINRTDHNMRGVMTNEQKIVLQQIISGGSLSALPKPMCIDDVSRDNQSLLFMTKEIQKYIIKNYDTNLCKKQFFLLGRYSLKENKNDFDFNIASAYYLMADLLCENYIDRIYPAQFMALSEKYDNVYNPIFDCIRANFLSGLEKYKPMTHLDQLNYKTYRIVNYMYKSYCTCRYNEIKNYLMLSNPIGYPVCSYNIPIKQRSNYPVFIVVELTNGKLLLY